MQAPEKGFYYHYKHDAGKGENDHAYEVLGVAIHTEDESFLVAYRPLYKNTFLGEADMCGRPLEMFMESVEKDGKTFTRFARITDASLIARLSKIRDTLYA